MGLSVTLESASATRSAAASAAAPSAMLCQKASSSWPRRSGMAMPSRIVASGLSSTLKGSATS